MAYPWWFRRWWWGGRSTGCRPWPSWRCWTRGWCRGQSWWDRTAEHGADRICRRSAHLEEIKEEWKFNNVPIQCQPWGTQMGPTMSFDTFQAYWQWLAKKSAVFIRGSLGPNQTEQCTIWEPPNTSIDVFRKSLSLLFSGFWGYTRQSMSLLFSEITNCSVRLSVNTFLEAATSSALVKY